MISFYPFLYSSHAHTNERNKVKAWVDNFIQITVFCRPSLNKVDTFVYWNAAKAYSHTCYLMIYLLITFNYFITLTSFNLWREITIKNCYWNDVKWRLRCKVYYTTQTQNYRVQWHFNIFLKKLNPYHGIKKKRPALNIEDNIELLQHCKQ